MKKLFSLMLVAMMLLTTLTGCNVLVTLQNLLDPTVPSATSPTTDTSTASSTTVTREEFLAAMECTNFTLSATDSTSTLQLMKLTETAMLQKETNPVNEHVRYEAYMAIVDNEEYRISKDGDTYVAIKDDFPTQVFRKTIISLCGVEDCNAIFDSLVYDEANKSYKYEIGTLTMDFRFENGNIKSLHTVITPSSSQVVVWDFYDFGTTVVELPEYTLASADSQ